MLKSTIKWYYIVIGHPGSKKLGLTLEQWYQHSEVCDQISKLTCIIYQKHKINGTCYVLLPIQYLKEQPSKEVGVDLIGHWKIQIQGKPYEFNTLTPIDTVTNLVEIVRIARKISE